MEQLPDRKYASRFTFSTIHVLIHAPDVPLGKAPTGDTVGDGGRLVPVLSQLGSLGHTDGK